MDRVDPPASYVRLDESNHWYKWSQRLGAYKWYSYRTPLAVQNRQRLVDVIVLVGLGFVFVVCAYAFFFNDNLSF